MTPGQAARETPGRIRIRNLEAADEDRWKNLWSGYLGFYSAMIEPAVTDHLWRCMLSGGKSHLGLAATEDGELVGFAHVIVHPQTFSITDAAYLEDLFVAPGHRKRGVGSALISHLLVLAGQHGWSRVYWHTKADNFTARRLYDQFVGADDMVRYLVKLG